MHSLHFGHSINQGPDGGQGLFSSVLRNSDLDIGPYRGQNGCYKISPVSYSANTVIQLHP